MTEKCSIPQEYIFLYGERLSKLCFSLCRNYADADDLFQDTWLKAIKNFDKYDKTRDFGKWLYAVCINTYKNMHLYTNRFVQFSTSYEKDVFLSSLPDNAEKNEKYDDLVAAVRELPDKYRTVLALRYFSDYSEKDVAEILNIPAGTVKSRLNKAKTIIRRRMSR